MTIRTRFPAAQAERQAEPAGVLVKFQPYPREPEHLAGIYQFESEAEESAVTLCPFCAETIQDASAVCTHCRRDLTPPPVPAMQVTRARVNAVRLVLMLLLLSAVGATQWLANNAEKPTPSQLADMTFLQYLGSPHMLMRVLGLVPCVLALRLLRSWLKERPTRVDRNARQQ